MSIRNVVRVMNFHALVRVDSAKKTAQKYMQMQERLMDMMAEIANNRNFRLDKRILTPPEKGKVLEIYLGSDYGFCGNYNSQVTEQLRKNPGAEKIIIGKKVHVLEGENPLLRCYRKEFDEEFDKVEQLLALVLRSGEYSSIFMTYNHYENTSNIYLKRIQLYPMQKKSDRTYTEDFAVEGDIDELYTEMLISYLSYEVLLAALNSSAAENVLRQNTTTESLKKIDEMENEALMKQRREQREKEFKKVVDNFVKKRVY